MIRRMELKISKRLKVISPKTYKLVQFSVHIAGLFGEFGPLNVSPHRLPLHEFIWHQAKFRKFCPNINSKKNWETTNHRIRRIILLAHDPWHTSSKPHSHLCSPIQVRNPILFKCFLHCSILILNLHFN